MPEDALCPLRRLLRLRGAALEPARCRWPHGRADAAGQAGTHPPSQPNFGCTPGAHRLLAPLLHWQIVSFDQDGVFDQAVKGSTKPPVKLLSRLEELGLLSSLAETGFLSNAEASGLFSKLEAAGAFSSAEKLLPLADKLNVLALAETLINVPSAVLTLGALSLLAGEYGLITVVPDDSTALVALQAVTGVVAGLGGVTLLAASYLFGLLQEA